MRIEYMRTAKQSYMIVKEAVFQHDAYEEEMILRNQLPCLLQFRKMQENGVTEYWYDVTGMQSLDKQYAVSPVNEAQIRHLLQNLIEMKYCLNEYLLDDQNICFTTAMIFYDRFANRLKFCYLPGYAGQKETGVQGLFEELLKYIDHKDAQAVRMGYDMYERCMMSEFVLEDCQECLTAAYRQGEGGKPKVDPEPESVTQNDFMKEQVPQEDSFEELEILRPDPQKKKSHKRKRKKEKKHVFHDYRKLLDRQEEISYVAEPGYDAGMTQFLSQEDLVSRWELIYKGNGLEKDICLDHFPFYVGKSAKENDGALKARTVSRTHAGLYLEGDKLFVEDYNSTNGTYVNNTLISMNTPVELHPGDRVVFATEEYQVHRRMGTKVEFTGLLW